MNTYQIEFRSGKTLTVQGALAKEQTKGGTDWLIIEGQAQGSIVAKYAMDTISGYQQVQE